MLPPKAFFRTFAEFFDKTATMKSKYLLLWLLLVAALGAVTAVSFSDDMTVLGLPVKKAPIAEALTGEYLTTAERAQADARAREQARRKAAPRAAPLDTAAQTIMVFGDSMSQNLALRLAAYARANGHTLHTVNWDSSGTRLWSQTDTLDAYLRRLRPTFIFVSLGANEAGAKHPEVYAPNIDKIVAKIGRIPFVWIGPPALSGDCGMSDVLLRQLPAGTFFRSDGMDLPRRKDRIHPSLAGAAMQVDSLARWMRQSAHPIRMAVPPDSLSHTRIRDIGAVYLKPQH